MKIGIILALFVAMMTCIFSTLDNAVTLYHASGVVNIGQWARVLLALSGLLAGFLFDTAGRKYMSMIMYCIMILSTTCLVVLQFAGPFTVGLLIFYLSAGFFAVFFHRLFQFAAMQYVLQRHDFFRQSLARSKICPRSCRNFHVFIQILHKFSFFRFEIFPAHAAQFFV